MAEEGCKRLNQQTKTASKEHDKESGLKLFVGNISYNVTRRELVQFLSKFGDVKKCYIVKDSKRSVSKGIGFITYADSLSAVRALSSTNEELTLYGRVLKLQYSKPKRKRQLLTTINVESNNDECLNEQDRVNKIEIYKDSTYVLKLTDDILLLIFTYLGLKDLIRLERVCRHWYRLSRQHWLSIKFLHFKNVFSVFRPECCPALTDNILLSLLKRCSGQLQCLDLSDSPRMITDYGLDIIGSHCPNLNELNLSGVSTTQSSLKRLSSGLLQLKSLTMKHCYLSEKSLWWCLHNMAQLEQLNIEDNRQITGKPTDWSSYHKNRFPVIE